MRRIAIFAAIAVVAVAVWAFAFTATVRYRLVLTAEVDGHPRIGSSVIEVVYIKNVDPISSAEYSANVRGGRLLSIWEEPAARCLLS